MPPNHQLRLPRDAADVILRWWRGLSKRGLTVAALAGSFLVSFLVFFSPNSFRDTVRDSGGVTEVDWVPLKTLSNARQKSAFCLDGSVPGYHIRSGFGSGTDSWIIHIEGGAWCNNAATCSTRKNTRLGSSAHMEREVQFVGIFSRDPLQNPDFFNWNKVKIRYCDGASFASHPENEPKIGKKLFFRGQLIFDAVMDELLSMGMSTARRAFLTGCSAGALSTFIHCDAFRNLLPKNTIVKCLSDGGFFLNEKDITGTRSIERYFHDVVQFQGVAKSLDPKCVARSNPSKCFFPQEFIESMATPLFLVQPAYDLWQVGNIFIPDSADPRESWLSCRLNILDCNSSQLEVLHGYRNSLLKALDGFRKKSNAGLFVDSCFVHCQTMDSQTWHSPTSPRINNKTIAEAVGDWYFGRAVSKHIYGPFPGNPTCYNMKFTEVKH